MTRLNAKKVYFIWSVQVKSLASLKLGQQIIPTTLVNKRSGVILYKYYLIYINKKMFIITGETISCVWLLTLKGQ